MFQNADSSRCSCAAGGLRSERRFRPATRRPLDFSTTRRACPRPHPRRQPVPVARRTPWRWPSRTTWISSSSATACRSPTTELLRAKGGGVTARAQLHAGRSAGGRGRAAQPGGHQRRRIRTGHRRDFGGHQRAGARRAGRAADQSLDAGHHRAIQRHGGADLRSGGGRAAELDAPDHAADQPVSRAPTRWSPIPTLANAGIQQGFRQRRAGRARLSTTITSR